MPKTENSWPNNLLAIKISLPYLIECDSISFNASSLELQILTPFPPVSPLAFMTIPFDLQY